MYLRITTYVGCQESFSILCVHMYYVLCVFFLNVYLLFLFFMEKKIHFQIILLKSKYLQIDPYHTYCVYYKIQKQIASHSTLYTRMVYAHSTPHFLCRYYCNAGRPKNYPQCRPQSCPMPILGCGHLYTTLLINSASAPSRPLFCRRAAAVAGN